MPVISLLDDSKLKYSQPIKVSDVATDIGPNLGKAALAGIVDGKMVDTSYVIENDVSLTIVTAQDEKGLKVLRHSTAHLLAQAVKILFPEAQVTIGPVIEDGFYYDFAFKRPFTQEDLTTIEKKMIELVEMDFPIIRRILDRDEAVNYFDSIGETYKAEIIKSLPTDIPISLYKQGEFEDLCRGPHVPSTGKIKAFKLMKVAGAYWRGDSNNEMLQRIYGTAWSSKKELEDYLHQLEEAEKRDHRKLGKKYDLFHQQEEAPGMVFWHPKGWTIYNTIEQYIRKKQISNGYKEVRTPQLVDMSLWDKSGHAELFGDRMFSVKSDGRELALKPMNCPCHIQIFNQHLRSYRDLPLRMTEFGCCHRNEFSGALYGIMRVRGFVQDDGHIFCTDEQIQSECAEFIDFVHEVYDDFGFGRDNLIYKLSTRPEKRVGSDEIWDKAEKALANALDAKQLPWEELPGEGAFYGPKIEFSLKDAIGRVWQCGTIQVDFSMPARLSAQYVAEDGSRQIPVMLHRAILGSFERFIGILIENYEGTFPLWLAPEQLVILNVTDRVTGYVKKVENSLINKGFRVFSDLRNEKINFKIREHTIQRVPYLIIIGDKEMETDTVTVRTRNGDNLGSMSIKVLNKLLIDELKCNVR